MISKSTNIGYNWVSGQTETPGSNSLVLNLRVLRNFTGDKIHLGFSSIVLTTTLAHEFWEETTGLILMNLFVFLSSAWVPVSSAFFHTYIISNIKHNEIYSGIFSPRNCNPSPNFDHKLIFFSFFCSLCFSKKPKKTQVPTQCIFVYTLYISYIYNFCHV